MTKPCSECLVPTLVTEFSTALAAQADVFQQRAVDTWDTALASNRNDQVIDAAARIVSACTDIHDGITESMSIADQVACPPYVPGEDWACPRIASIIAARSKTRAAIDFVNRSTKA